MIKLTNRGSDYLLAAVALAIISSILNVGIMVSLAMGMGIAAIAALVIVKVVRSKNIKVELHPNSQKLFKRDRFVIDSNVRATAPRWVSARVTSIEAPFGVRTESKIISENSLQLSMEPFFAGRHKGVKITLELRDPMDLFKKEVELEYSDFTIDALPDSLLLGIPKMKLGSLGFGEAPSRLPGGNVELESIDEYRPFGETKNILWKKVARMPDEKIIVRVREANTPKSIKIGLVRNAKRDKLQDRVRMMDRVCESIGLLGNSLFSVGCSVEILQLFGEAPAGILSLSASTIDELSDILMKIWDIDQPPLATAEIAEIVQQSDIIVTGFREVQNKNVAALVSKKLSVLIKEGTPPPAYASEKTTVYSGDEDLRSLVIKAVSR